MRPAEKKARAGYLALVPGPADVSDAYRRAFPACAVLEGLADRWVVLVVAELAGRTLRFSELQRRINGISSRMLSKSLRTLERDGLVTRTVHPVSPPHVDYALTPLGRTLIDPIAALHAWAVEHGDDVLEAREHHDDASAVDATPWLRPRAFDEDAGSATRAGG